MTANKFNQAQLDSGEMAIGHVTRMVEFWQRHHGLAVDGYAGANTLNSLGGGIEKIWPLRSLPDGRVPVITSGFYTENPSRSTHKGVDLFYKWIDSDPDVAVGNGGAIRVNGKRRWWYPDGAMAIAAADGVVQKADNSETGHRVWIDHGNGERTGYFHGSMLLVQKGDILTAGDPVIAVGDNPSVHDAKHLHFEVSPVDRYAPKNPRTWLEDASVR